MSTPTTTTGFLRDLVDQMRAGDTYGQLDRLSDEVLLKPFIVERTAKREIAVNCDVDAVTESRLRAYYQAIAAGAEKATGVFTATVLDLSHEGFGRVVIFAGKLVIFADVLRDAQRFGFASLEKLSERGEKLVANAVAAIEKYREVARDDD